VSDIFRLRFKHPYDFAGFRVPRTDDVGTGLRAKGGSGGLMPPFCKAVPWKDRVTREGTEDRRAKICSDREAMVIDIGQQRARQGNRTIADALCLVQALVSASLFRARMRCRA